MARISGIDIPKEKKVPYSLCYIHGIGLTLAKNICEYAKVDENKILAIGDGVNTDIKGANSEEIDSLFVTGGLAAKETKTSYNPNPEALKKYITKQKVDCTYSIGYLR